MKTIAEPKDRKWLPVIFKDQGKILGILLYLILFTGACVTFSSCVGGYVLAEPSYSEVYERPASPGIGYVWIEGDWRWNNQANIYVHEHGYWARPKTGRSYEAGHWESGPRGKFWVRGRWHREGRDRDRDRDRDHDHDNSRR